MWTDCKDSFLVLVFSLGSMLEGVTGVILGIYITYRAIGRE